MFNLKEAKAKARVSVKQHYVIFILALLLASFTGAGYTTSLSAIKSEETTVEFGGAYTLFELTLGDTEIAKDVSDSIDNFSKENTVKLGPIEIGHKKGVLAGLVNGLTSGSIFVVLYSTVARVLGEGSIIVKILIVLAGLLLGSLSIFVVNVYAIAYKRIFLESYNYKQVKSNRFAYLLRCKKAINVAIAMLLKDVFETLWWLTIIGGPIASYRYSQVEFILAENPSIKPMEAIRLSKEMMKGHKWEMFKNELSFIGWFILDICTFGLSAIFYSNAYLEAFKTEYYAYLRKLAYDNKLEGYELLNDKYLYENASMDDLKVAYADVLKNKDIEVDYPEMKGIKGFLARYFGIVLKYDDVSKQFDRAMEEEYEYELYDDIFTYKNYPSRLCPTKEPEKYKSERILAARRLYSVSTLILTFFNFSLVGWLWEVSLHLVNDGQFVNRGVLHGPWLPVYGSGVLLILVVLYRLRKNVPLEFGSAIVLCGLVEYFTSLYLELTKGMRWWDYSGYFLNIDGRICAEGLLIFGLGGLAAVYILVPMIDNEFRKVKSKILIPICIVLIVAFTCDSIYSKSHPNTGKGITDYQTTSQLESVDKRC